MKPLKSEVVKINKSELEEAVRENYVEPGCDVINSDVARDPKFREMIQDRLETVGNNDYANMSAALTASPQPEPKTISKMRRHLRAMTLGRD
jgi:hypothetical protein